jgi:SAM-dependent methyltransferase
VKCRNCGGGSLADFIDLGSAPLSNAYLTEETLRMPELWVPLKVVVCTDCWLAQTEDYLTSEEIFTADYAYFSSASISWLEHAERFVDESTLRFDLGKDSLVVEVAANDGYLLRFVQERGIPCIGIEPTTSTADAARVLGLEMVEEFVGVGMAAKFIARYGSADLVVANNVLAHVPDVADFVGGLATLMKPQGVLSVEFPRLTSLVDGGQFDTTYHEHFSYLSLHSASSIFERAGLAVFDVEEIATHGGSLRVFAQQAEGGGHRRDTTVDEIMQFESERGVTTLGYYQELQARAESIKDDFVRFLIDCKAQGRSVAAYGAAAKGNTLLNFAGVRPDLLPFVVDKSESKIGRYLPGSRIPIVREEEIRSVRPDFIVILPWNIADEVMEQLSYAREWGARFVTAVPELGVS